MKQPLLCLLMIITALNAQHSNRLLKDLEYDIDITYTISELEKKIFNHTYDGKIYYHSINDQYFYKVVVISDLNWHRLIIGRLMYNKSNGNPVSGSDRLWSVGEPGGAGVGIFKFPKGLAVAYHSSTTFDIYVADSGNNRIVKCTFSLQDGNIINIAYFTATSNGGFNNPVDVEVAPYSDQDPSDDKLWVVDSYNHRIVYLNCSDGYVIKEYGSFGSDLDKLHSPTSITLNRFLDIINDITIWVSDNGNNRLVKLYTANDIYPVSVYNFPYETDIMEIEHDQTGYCIYAVDRLNHKIHKFLSIFLFKTGEYGSFGTGEDELKYPISLTSPTPLYAGDGYYGGSQVGILESWTDDSGIKLFGTEGVDIQDLDVVVNPQASLATYSYKMPSGIAVITETLKDGSGNTVRTIVADALSYGGIRVGAWDRKDDSGVLLPQGNYKLNIQMESFWSNSERVPLDMIADEISFDMIEDTLWMWASEGKSQHSVATYPNNARQLVRGGGYLHQIFFSGWEIFYRRQPENGNWEDPVYISNRDGGYRYPCIAYGDNRVFVIWQRIYMQSGSYRFDILFRRYDSTNGWSDPVTIANTLAMSSYQAEPLPVIAFDPIIGKLYAIYCCDQGLLYQTSSDYGSTWSGTPSTISTSNRVRYPTVSFNNDHMVVLYERRFEGIWSNYFSNSTWSNAARIDADLPTYSPFTPSVTLNKDGKPHATWIAYPTGQGKYAIIFRRGNSDNTWNSTWYEIRSASYYNFRNPSISLHPYSVYNHDIIICHSDDNNAVFVQYYEKQTDKWNKTQLSSSGKYPNMSEEFEINEDPFVHFTNQSQSPYLVEEHVVDDGFAKRSVIAENEEVSQQLKFLKRVAVFTHKAENSKLILDFEPMVGISRDGKEVEIPFNILPVLDSVNIDFNNISYFFGISNITLDNDISDIRLKLSTREAVFEDSLESRIRNIPRDSYELSMKIEQVSTDSNSIVMKINKNSSVNIDVRELEGKVVNMYPIVKFKDIAKEDFNITIGNVYTVYPSTMKKEHGEETISHENLPETYRLDQNYPNPFNPITTIIYQLPERSKVNISIYDLLGKRIKELVNTYKNPGNYLLQWNAKNENDLEVASGIYIYVLKTDKKFISKKMILIR